MRTVAGSNVCVVGGAGFLGSHMVEHLLSMDCRVTVIDNLVVGRHLDPRAEFLHHDITTSEEFMLKAFKTRDIRFVFNYAAYPYVPTSYARPLQVFNVNAMGAMKVINAAHEAGCEAILQVSSAEVYGDPGPAREARYDEDTPVSSRSSYGASKAAIDAYVQCRWHEAQVPCIALRQFNCIGERETHPYVVPEIISQLSKQQLTMNEVMTDAGECLTSYDRSSRYEVLPGETQWQAAKVHLGNNSTRDFMYAGDAVRMAVELLERGTFGDVYNLGSEQSIGIYELADTIGIMMGFNTITVEKDENRVRKWEIWHLQSDNKKLYDAGVSRAETTLEEALQLTIRNFNETGRKWSWER
jgi:UDP-glucose 4-epimerase